MEDTGLIILKEGSAVGAEQTVMAKEAMVHLMIRY